MAKKYFETWRTRQAHSGKIPESAWEAEPISRHNTLDAARLRVELEAAKMHRICGATSWSCNYGITDPDGCWVD